MKRTDFRSNKRKRDALFITALFMPAKEGMLT